ncbi:homoserine kinase [Streptococcus sp. DD12]|uniref:homoserine kinase n=1 Tax=Streptococcus sp. DD12 TaxID=1777880 RepID=UPI00079B09C4|nr:homoserine kinase [Streptococcus sp. DD12]KXT76561.1 Homoserine kinase [Streptococcus sp. DD12]
MKITVPATSANIGPGFDSVGIAVSKYLTITIAEESPEWLVEHQLGEDVPSDARNLLIATALEVAPELQPHRIIMTSDIPLARGLGSSSSVIVAGIELANQLAQLQLSAKEKLAIATRIEGHPDNVAPAIYGNLVVAASLDDQVSALVTPVAEVAFHAFIPNYELKTSDSRKVLPQELPYKEAVTASAIANLAVAGMIAGDWELAGQAIARDRFHEKYRQPLVKEFEPVRQTAKEMGAYATYLSGAGPTIMTIISKDQVSAFKKAVEALQLDGSCHILSVDTKGIRVE